MARAKSKTKRQSKGARGEEPKKRGASKRQSGGNDLEKRWSAYWQHRGELEEAIAKVREAREALARLVEIERTRRAAFEQVKTALTELLDVEPATPVRPAALPSDPKDATVKAKA